MYLTRFRRTIKLKHIFDIWLLLVKWLHFITLSPFAFMSNRFIAQYESLHIYLMLHIFIGYIITVSIIVMKIPNPAAIIAHKCQMGRACCAHNLLSVFSGFFIVFVCCLFFDFSTVWVWACRRVADLCLLWFLNLQPRRRRREIIRLDEIQLTSSQDDQWSRSSLTQSVKVKLKGEKFSKRRRRRPKQLKYKKDQQSCLEMFGDNVSSGTIYTVQLLISCPKAALSTSSSWFSRSRLQLWRGPKIKSNKKVPFLYQRLSGLTSVYVQVRSSKTGGVGAETRFNKRCTDRLV